MTGRERLNAVLRKQPKDRLPWTTIVDNATLALLPEALRENGWWFELLLKWARVKKGLPLTTRRNAPSAGRIFRSRTPASRRG